MWKLCCSVVIQNAKSVCFVVLGMVHAKGCNRQIYTLLVIINRNVFLLQKSFSSKGINSDGKKSLFAQQFALTGGMTFGVPEQKINDVQLSAERTSSINMESNATRPFPRSSLISGEGLMRGACEKMEANREVEEIHNENIAKLDSMTRDEIMEEQARIKSSLGE